MSQSSNHGASKNSHRSKTNFSKKQQGTNDFLDSLLQCNNVSIQHFDPNNKTPISITKVDKDYFSPELKQALIDDEKSHKPSIVSVNLSEPLTARLAFVLADISLEQGKCYKPVTVLHDSGCSLSILSFDVFRQFPDSHKAKLEPVTNLRVESFEGTQSSIVGMIDIFIRFSGSNGVQTTFKHPVLVHQSTKHDLMLGRDLQAQRKIIGF